MSLIAIFVSVVSIPLAVASDLGLSTGETTAWILVLYGLPGVLSLVLAWRYRQPLMLTGNIFILIFIASLGRQLTWPELVGASMVAGALVLLLGLLGLTDRLAAWLPSPIVFGLLAGAVLPLFVRLFTALNDALAVVGGTLVAYLFVRVLLGSRLPAILPALVVGVLIAAFTGQLAWSSPATAWPVPSLTPPTFSLRALVTATPVMVALISLQANAPSVVFLRSQGYRPPERVVTAVSGWGTLLGSLMGPMGVSLSLPATALSAGTDAGERDLRHRTVYIAGSAALVFGLLAGFAAELDSILPRSLLVAVVGLAVIGVLVSALEQVSRGPLVLGPMFAFAIALSELSLLGLGSFFWALAIGLLVSFLLEWDQWKELRADALA